MGSFFTSFLVSAVLNLFLIKLTRALRVGLDIDLLGVQKVHLVAIPRIGGAGIFASVLFGAIIAAIRAPKIGNEIFLLLFCSAFAFLGGMIEDVTRRVSPMRRLAMTMLAAIMGFYLVNGRIERIDLGAAVWYLDNMWIMLPFTVLAVAGIANAVNIIDGFNGLAGVVTMCMLLSLGYVAFQVHDSYILVTSLIIAGAIAGFLIWNYPNGLIFLGDGGAYFLGFMLGELAILIVLRNPQVSSWYALLLVFYPVFETLFSIYRRFFIRGRSPSAPDGIHLHSLIFRRVVVWAMGPCDARSITQRNALTSPYLWLLSLIAVVPATLFWRHTVVLMLFCVFFAASYLWLYTKIVRFKAPRWMRFHRGK